MQDKKIEFEEEKKYLKSILKEIELQRNEKRRELALLVKKKQEFSLHFSDDFYTMDDEEALSEGDLLNEIDIAYLHTKKIIDRLNRQEYSPYFGRVEFKERGKRKNKSYYIGVNNLVKPGKDLPLICDWRAPVSTLFYDYELGDAEYIAPDGKVCGTTELKRQFEIKNKELVKLFDSSLTIGDDILKDMLSKSASKKMKTIVSTIQKEQNKIIRNNNMGNMLVQGVAGSGKTSIALHRVAYLLYQNKNTLKAEDVLILSPNTLFSEYISDVLPELGEENVSQMTFYRLAKEELGFLNLPFESREENLSELTKNHTKLNQVAYKHTFDFYESLKQYCELFFNVAFVPKDLKFGKDVIKAEEMLNLYNKTYLSKSPAIRVEWIVDYIIDKLNINEAIKEIAERLKRIIYPFFVETDIFKIYSGFLQEIGMDFKLNKNGKISYDDLAPLMYIVNYFLGLKSRNEVKYLIIDEMQDYSFVHYSVLNSIFNCNKTVLGDINQCVEKVMGTHDLVRLKEMLNAEIVELNKTYRSTAEIVEFASKLKNIKCEMFARRGKEPQIINSGKIGIVEVLHKLIQELDYGTIAILTKTEDEAKQVYLELSDFEDIALILNAEEGLKRVSIIPSYIAKGMEFDAVIVPNYNKRNYNNFLDNNLLYISCTRALHELFLVK